MQVDKFIAKLRVVGAVGVPEGTTVVGIDQSLTACGICVLSGGEVRVAQLAFPPNPERQSDIYRFFGRFFQEIRPNHAAIEGYAFGKPQGMAALGELGGIIRLTAQLCKVPLVAYPPTTVKKFVTGSGNAAKSELVKDLYKHFAIDVKTDNEADAASLAVMEAARLGLIEVSKARREAVIKGKE